MNDKKDLILQFINFKVDQLITNLKMEIENVFHKDFLLKPEEVQPLIDKILADMPSAAAPSQEIGLLDALSQLDSALKQAGNQKELIETLFAFLDDFAAYIGFFIFKGNNAVCYAAKGSGNKPQKDMKIKKAVFLKPVKPEDGEFPEELKQFFTEGKTIAIPLLIKFKQAGFFVFEMLSEDYLKLGELAASIFERELTLLPLKTHGELKTQQFKTMEKPEPPKPAQEPKPATAAAPKKTTSDDDPVMKKVKRYVNALASDIKLYNREKIEKGLKEGNLRELLAEDIERSYQAFRERYPDKDKFPDSLLEEALIKYVANGNPDLL